MEKHANFGSRMGAIFAAAGSADIECFYQYGSADEILLYSCGTLSGLPVAPLFYHLADGGKGAEVSGKKFSGASRCSAFPYDHIGDRFAGVQ